MDKKALTTQIDACEKHLIQLSQKVEGVPRADSFTGWLLYVLESDLDLARALNLPTEESPRVAAITLLRTSTAIAAPLSAMLARRTGVFLSTLADTSQHVGAGDRLAQVNSRFDKLRELLAQFDHHGSNARTLRLVRLAIKAGDIHRLRTNPEETPIRVALRSFYEDQTRDSALEITSVLDFILQELAADVRTPGRVRHARQFAWGALTLVKEAPRTWLDGHRREITQIARRLGVILTQTSPSMGADAGSLVSDLYSTANERIWTVINAVRFARAVPEAVLPQKVARELLEAVEDQVDAMVKAPPSAMNLKMLQSRLVLLYEAFELLLDFEVANILKGKQLRLSEHLIGTLLYDEDTMRQFAKLQARIRPLIEDRQSWKKPTQGAMVISGGAGQGKTELAKQIANEIRKLADASGAQFRSFFFTAGTDLVVPDDLAARLREIRELEETEPDSIRVVLFDEFDKAGFDFYLPFLPLLERSDKSSGTFWLFAQSRFPSYADLKAFAETLENKSMRDFLTRMLLGSINLSPLRSSPPQRLLTVLGMAAARTSKEQGLARVSQRAVASICWASGVSNNRDLLRLLSDRLTIAGRDLDAKVEADYVGIVRQAFGATKAHWIELK